MTEAKKRTTKRKLFIASRYVKHYSLWAILVLVLLLLGKTIHKNSTQKHVATTDFVTPKKQHPIKIASVKRKPLTVNQDKTVNSNIIVTKETAAAEQVIKPTPVQQHRNDSKVAILEKQLFEEKEKNKDLVHSLSNQEQQLISALNNINESYKQELKSISRIQDLKVANVETTSIVQSDYYMKVRTALNKKPTSTIQNSLQESLSINEPEENMISSSDEG